MCKILTIALAIAFGVISIAPSLASASVWEVGEKSVTSNVAIKTKGAGGLKFEDTKTIGGAASVECEITAEGTVGTSGKGEVTSVSATGCKAIKVCEASGVSVKAVHLPWHTQLEEVESTRRERISSGGSGAPGWLVECLILGILIKDECTGETTTGTENETEGAYLYFDPKSAHVACTQGGAGAGVVTGALIDENPAAGRLGVSGDDPPCDSLPPNVTYGAQNESKTITILNCNTIARVDIDSVSNDKEGEFKLGKKCTAGTALDPLGGTKDHCDEIVTFTGACATPPAKATFTVTANPGGRTFRNKLTGC
jgi:hypothetical protein